MPSRSQKSSFGFQVIAWLKKLTLPPAGPLLLAILSLGLPEPWRFVGLASGLLALWLSATPLVGLCLIRSLEKYPPLDLDASEGDSEAVVVLDAGRYLRVDEVKPETLERLRHGAKVARSMDLPILASGDGAGPLMGQILAEDFGRPARWLEVKSRNTQENANRSAAMLAEAGLSRVILVTHAWHMPRAVRAFERAGLQVVPAPCALAGPDRQELRWLSLLPSAGGLLMTFKALHEWIGLGWYALRYRR